MLPRLYRTWESRPNIHGHAEERTFGHGTAWTREGLNPSNWRYVPTMPVVPSRRTAELPVEMGVLAILGLGAVLMFAAKK